MSSIPNIEPACGGSICKALDFETPWFRHWSAQIGNGAIHRKVWEWAIQSRILFERDMLRPGRHGIGFAVGQEPLASLFASLGATVDATDLPPGDTAAEWASTGQHAANLDALHHPGIVDRDKFDERVRFFPVNMTDLSSLPSETYDFLWSSCALEHLGTLERGLSFIREAMRLLKVGGIACHTTEYNISDMENTIESGSNVIYRKKDFDRLSGQLRKMNCLLYPMDFDYGSEIDDIIYDVFPWGSRGQKHIKLEMDGFVCTSAVLVCRRYA